MATTFSNVDLSKVDWSQYEDEDDAPHGTAPPPQHHQQAAVGGDVPFDRMGLDDDDDFGEHDQTWRVTCVDERDVGCEFSLLGGAVTKKCLGAAQNPEPENPEDGWAVEIDYTACVCGAAKITEGGELDVAPVEGAEEPLPPFEQGVGSYFRLDAGMLPTGVEAAIKTMREGERALVTVQPAPTPLATQATQRAVCLRSRRCSMRCAASDHRGAHAAAHLRHRSRRQAPAAPRAEGIGRRISTRSS